MQTYDMLMLVVLVAATLFGFWKGMAWQIASLASFVLSYYAALRFSTELAPYFGDQAPLNRFIAMLAIYVATSLAIWMIFRLVSRIIDRVKLEGFDRQLGGILGFAKGVLLCVAITFFAVTLLGEEQGRAIMASRSGGYIVALLNNAHAVVPPELHPHLQQIEERLNPNGHPNASLPQSGQSLQDLWRENERQQPAADWPQQPQPAWPMPSNTTPPPWPIDADTTAAANATSTSANLYPAPREPRPFPGPYSAQPAAAIER
jgi:membrane protein required for colicin V production